MSGSPTSKFGPKPSTSSHQGGIVISNALPSLPSPHGTPNSSPMFDTGATNHMLPDHSAFYSYHSCKHRYVTLGDDTRLQIFGTGTAIIALNGKNVLI